MKETLSVNKNLVPELQANGLQKLFGCYGFQYF